MASPNESRRMRTEQAASLFAPGRHVGQLMGKVICALALAALHAYLVIAFYPLVLWGWEFKRLLSPDYLGLPIVGVFACLPIAFFGLFIAVAAACTPFGITLLCAVLLRVLLGKQLVIPASASRARYGLWFSPPFALLGAAGLWLANRAAQVPLTSTLFGVVAIGSGIAGLIVACVLLVSAREAEQQANQNQTLAVHARAATAAVWSMLRPALFTRRSLVLPRSPLQWMLVLVVFPIVWLVFLIGVVHPLAGCSAHGCDTSPHFFARAAVAVFTWSIPVCWGTCLVWFPIWAALKFGRPQPRKGKERSSSVRGR